MRTRIDVDSLVLLVIRILVGGIFLIAALSKIVSPGDFADTVRAFHLLPPSLVVPFALILPWLELLAAAYLLAGFMTRVGAAAAAGMLLIFIAALTDALVTGNTAHPCGCFGSLASNPVIALLAGGTTIGWWDVVRDVILLALSVMLIWRGGGAYSVDTLLHRERSTGHTRRTAWNRS
jgi:uncharacterized membrane protein YphA (DoxX/SURF4 family)